jgi:hypothetical protein
MADWLQDVRAYMDTLRARPRPVSTGDLAKRKAEIHRRRKRKAARCG